MGVCRDMALMTELPRLPHPITPMHTALFASEANTVEEESKETVERTAVCFKKDLLSLVRCAWRRIDFMY